jgi:hypothetical protein
LETCCLRRWTVIGHVTLKILNGIFKLVDGDLCGVGSLRPLRSLL